jgi:hypothetical protein
MALVSDEMMAYALQLQELEKLEAQMQLRGPETTEHSVCDDLRAALALQRHDLQCAAVCAADHAIVVRGAQDYATATDLARAFDTMALQERNDHALARRLAGTRQAGPAAPPEPHAAELTDVAEAKQPASKMHDPFGLLLSSVGSKHTCSTVSSSAGLAAPPDEAPSDEAAHQRSSYSPFNMSGLLSGARRATEPTPSSLLFSRVSGRTATSSSTTPRPAAAPAAAAKHEGSVQCSFCLEDTRRPTKLACGKHCSCRECLTKLYSTALEDTALIPVKCCGQLLEYTLASIVLPAAKLKRYRALEAEATTVSKMYCPKPFCSAFISLDGINLDSRYARLLQYALSNSVNALSYGCIYRSTLQLVVHTSCRCCGNCMPLQQQQVSESVAKRCTPEALHCVCFGYLHVCHEQQQQ